MSQKPDRKKSADLGAALGASRHVHLPPLSAQGPLGLLQLRSELAHRLRSSGGRPTDPGWTVRRVVPFRPEGWAELEQLAARLTAAGRSVSPAQLAAILIERGLAALEAGVEAEGDSALGDMVP